MQISQNPRGSFDGTVNVGFGVGAGNVPQATTDETDAVFLHSAGEGALFGFVVAERAAIIGYFIEGSKARVQHRAGALNQKIGMSRFVRGVL